MKRGQIFFFATLMIMFFIVFAMPLLAQDGEEPMFDPGIVELILVAGIGGVGVRALTAALKNWLKVKGFLAVIVSLVVCAAATAVYLIPAGIFSWGNLAGYTAFVFVSANLIYRATKSG